MFGEGVNPIKCRFSCATCGDSVSPTRFVGTTQSVPVECDADDCLGCGTVVKNHLGMVTGTYGAVDVEVSCR